MQMNTFTVAVLVWGTYKQQIEVPNQKIDELKYELANTLRALHEAVDGKELAEVIREAALATKGKAMVWVDFLNTALK